MPFVKRCLSSCKSLDQDAIGESNREQLAEIIRTYFMRREAIENTYIDRLEGYFHNYLAYYLFNKPYINFPSLMLYVRNALFQFNIIKFLLFMNPKLDPLLESSPGLGQTDENKLLLDEAIVETCYQCARGFDHVHGKLLDVAAKELDSQGYISLERLTMLAKT